MRPYQIDYTDKNQWNEYYRQKLLCTLCEIYISRAGFSTHKKTHKHIENIKIYREKYLKEKSEDETKEQV